MAAIVNDRDVLLQAASARLLNMPLPSNIFIPGVSGINLRADSIVIKVDANGGNPVPALVTITAELKQVEGTVVWDLVAGSANILGSGNTVRFMDNANMFTDSITVRARITHNAITYQSLLTISRIRDGANGTPGTPGANGQRGSVNVYMAVGAPGWSDSVADNAIISYTGAAQKIVGDTATLIFSNTWSQLRYWNGFAWTQPGTVINGDLLVTQSVAADKMAANSITAANGAIADFAVTSAKIAQEIASDQWYATGGAQGWVINRNGGAVFRNVLVRGDVHATSINADSITTNHLQVNSVNTERIVPGAVTNQAYGAAEGEYNITSSYGVGVSAALECHNGTGLIQISALYKPKRYTDTSNNVSEGTLFMLVTRNGSPIYDGPYRTFLFGLLGLGTVTWSVQFREVNTATLPFGVFSTVTNLLITVGEYRR